MENIDGKIPDKKKETGMEAFYSFKRRIILIIFFLTSFSICTSMGIIVYFLQKTLVDDTREKSIEISNMIQNCLRTMMITRSGDSIQETLEEVVRKGFIVKAAIINDKGKIIYSSDKSERGVVIDRNYHEGCSDCHREFLDTKMESSAILFNKDGKFHRNISIIFNEQACHQCHRDTSVVNGKLIIDRSIGRIDRLIFFITLVILISGILCIIFIYRIISWGVNKYIYKITGQYDELSMLYTLVESISRIIDIDDLKDIILSALHKFLNADEIVIIMPSNDEYRVTSWSSQHNKSERMKIISGSTLEANVEKWLAGRFEKEWVSEDSCEVCYPFRRNGDRLALLYINRKGNPFDQFYLRLIKVISGHISAAFENVYLYKIAITDELTGLYSLRHFRENLSRVMRKYLEHAEPFSLLMMDVDNFKQVNDTYGHPAGDVLLKEIVNCIMASIRDSDRAFRYGGEEFAVILPSAEVSESIMIAERIRGRVSETLFLKGNHDLKTTISIGVATCPGNARSSEELVNLADQALYQAKKSGKNVVIVSSSGAGKE